MIIDGVDVTQYEIISMTDLSDVTISDIVDNDLLQYNLSTGEWENVTIGSLNTNFVPYDGATKDVNLGANILSVDSDIKIALNGIGGNTYLIYNSGADQLELWKGGVLQVSW